MRKKTPLSFPKPDRSIDIFDEIAAIDRSPNKDMERWNDLHVELAELCETDQDLACSSPAAQELIRYVYMFGDDQRANDLMVEFTEKGIGQRNPLWIACLALTYERVKNYVTSFSIYEENLQDNTSKAPFVLDKYNDFKKRVEYKLRDNETFSLGILNGISYKWEGGRIVCRNAFGPAEPEIDILSIINYKPSKSLSGSTITQSKKKDKEQPAYDTSLIIKYGSFIEARLALMPKEADKSDNFEKMELPKKSPMRKRKPLALISRKEPEQNDFFEKEDEEEPRPILKKKSSLNPTSEAYSFFDKEDEEPKPIFKKKSSLNRRADENELFGAEDDQSIPIIKKKRKLNEAPDLFNQENEEPRPRPKRKPLAPISRASFMQDDDDEEERPPLLKKRSYNREPDDDEEERPPLLKKRSYNREPDDDEKTTSILRAPGSPRASPSRVRIAQSESKRRTAFGVGDEFSNNDCRITIKGKNGKNSYLCVTDKFPYEYILKINPAPSCLTRLEYSERFALQDKHFDTYFISLFVKYEFSSIVEKIHMRKRPDELVVMFFLFELNRILISLENIKCCHGAISIENLRYSINENELCEFNDNEDWRSTGVVLTNCDKIKEGSGSDRNDVKKIICILINRDPENETIPKLWKHKDFWELAFKALSNSRVSLNQIEKKANMILRENGMAIRSRISQFNVALQQ